MPHWGNLSSFPRNAIPFPEKGLTHQIKGSHPPVAETKRHAHRPLLCLSLDYRREQSAHREIAILLREKELAPTIVFYFPPGTAREEEISAETLRKTRLRGRFCLSC